MGTATHCVICGYDHSPEEAHEKHRPLMTSEDDLPEAPASKMLRGLRELAQSIVDDSFLDEIAERFGVDASNMWDEQQAALWKKYETRIEQAYTEELEQRIKTLAFCTTKPHEWVDDQCGIPEHRYCANCGTLIPEEEVERGEPANP